MPIPVETRKKMFSAVALVARRFEVTQQGLRNLIKRCRERGSIKPLKTGPRSRPN